MAARPNLPLKPRPANLPPNFSRRIERLDSRLLDQRLARIAFGPNPNSSRHALRADFFLPGVEISFKLRRR